MQPYLKLKAEEWFKTWSKHLTRPKQKQKQNVSVHVAFSTSFYYCLMRIYATIVWECKSQTLEQPSKCTPLDGALNAQVSLATLEMAFGILKTHLLIGAQAVFTPIDGFLCALIRCCTTLSKCFHLVATNIRLKAVSVAVWIRRLTG